MRIIVILGFLLLFLSCVKDKKLLLANESEILVLYCTFNPDSTWELRLSSTVSIGQYSQTFPKINGALVTLFENNILIDTFSNSSDGIYTSALKPLVNKSYTVKVIADGFDKIEATDSLPINNGNILVHELQNQIIPKKLPPPSVDEVYYVAPVNLSIEDKLSERNYYRIESRARIKDASQIPQEVLDNGLLHYEKETLITDDDRFEPFNIDDAVICFKDVGLDGQTFNMRPYFVVGANVNDFLGKYTFFFEPNSLDYFDNGYNLIGRNYPTKIGGSDRWDLEYQVILKTISKTYYEYTRSRMLQNYNRTIPGSQFNNVYSNVQGGKGIFAGFQIQVKALN